MQLSAFYFTAAIAVAATAMVIVSRNAVHGLLHLVVSFLACAVIFFQLGAPFAAALEVIVYAGAILVLMVFVIMLLNQGKATVQQENAWLRGENWLGPAILSALLLAQLLFLLWGDTTSATPSSDTLATRPKAVGLALFGKYLLAVELASLLLLAALVGASHLARRPAHASGRREIPDGH
ncbi:NADH-quinone oxidoreductase subunit J [Microbulbifer aggregans]|uniref:NADH-quinone oxidoreductase subunit J n=1 Tax=Microbulbifer aggregans TaxID=1769779 RepID=UPI001CFD3F06|nr:NADH-quinone oxidoreductase subunit J [Microbulbifer aggregans]